MGLSSYLYRKEKIDFSLVTGRTQIMFVTKNIKKVEDAGYIKVYRLGPRPIDFINGFIAQKGEEVGIPAPTNAALTELVRRVERGEIEAHPRNIETI